MNNFFLCLLLIFVYSHCYSQCECTDCPVPIVGVSTTTSELDISGADNDELGVNGQQLCQICIEVTHDAIREVDMILIAPDGSSVDLMIKTIIDFGEDMMFEICFVSCDQTAEPDSGFPEEFDTDAGWEDNTLYDGTYYPADGCLEDLTGDVNGEWTLEMFDGWFLEDGDLFDWYLVFADDSGLDCDNAGECGDGSSCIADGGELPDDDYSLCEGDDDLDFDIEPDHDGSPPPSSDYGYTFIITDLEDVIIDYDPDSDLTDFEPGVYLICGLSYLLDDEDELPNPNGSVTTEDIEDEIEDGDYCADLSENCFEVEIKRVPIEPDIEGPDEVCAGELVEYENLEHDEQSEYIVTITEGDYAVFFEDGPGIWVVEWESGPAEICFTETSACGDETSCLDIDVIEPLEVEIEGEFFPCPRSIENYQITPNPGNDQEYDYSVTGGSIIDEGENFVEIEWGNLSGDFELCVELIDPICEFDPFCEEIEIQEDYQMPEFLIAPEEICQGTTQIIEIEEDDLVDDYIWTSTNLEITDGQGTERIEYRGINPGEAELCLEIETFCGIQGPLCALIEVLELPMPTIEALDPTCQFDFILEANVDSNSDIIWTQIDGPSNADISEEEAPITDVQVSEAGTFTFELKETIEICENTTEIEVLVLGEIELSEPEFICNAQNEYLVSFEILSGQAPFDINGASTSATSFESQPIESEMDYFFEVIDDLGCSSILTGSYVCPCFSDAGSMSTDQIIICIADQTQFSGTWNNDGTFDSNDIGTYILHDEASNLLGQILAVSESGTFEYTSNLEIGKPYYISYVVGNENTGEVDLNDECLSVSFGQEVIFYDISVVALNYEEAICGLETTLQIPANEDIEDIQFSLASGPGNATFTLDNLNQNITVDEYGTYLFNVTVTNQACTNIQTISMRFLDGPSITEVAENCDGSGSNYQVSFLLTGEAPFNSTQGTIDNDNRFTSNEIESGTAYEIEVTDANGCSSLINGNKLCDCISDAGFITSPSEILCINESIQVIVIDSILDTDDLGFFILHDGTNNSIGNVIDSNTSGIFNYENGYPTETVYTINFIVGDEINGSIDFNDLCFDQSNSITVQWLQAPDIFAGDDIESCSNEIQLSASPLSGNWNLISAPNTASLIFDNENIGNTIARPDTPGVYQLEWSSSNAACEASDTLILILNPSPTITNLKTQCSDDLLSYEISFDIAGGIAPYSVNGTQINGNNYQTQNINPSVITDFQVMDSNGCESAITSGPIDCSCISDIGTFQDLDTEFCTNELIELNLSNNDFINESNQVLSYVIHNGDAENLGNIILILNEGSILEFSNIFDVDTEYYLTPILSTLTNGQLDFDPCFVVSEGLPFVWTESSDINFSFASTLCIGDDISFNPNISGKFPIELTLTDGTGNERIVLLEDENSEVDFEDLNASIALTLTSALGTCISSAEGRIDIEIIPPLNVSLSTELEICNNPDFNSRLALSDLLSDDQIIGSWETDNIDIISDSLVFDNVPAGSYLILFNTEGFEDPCPGSIFSTEIQVTDCDCPVFSNEEIEICSDQNELDLSQLDTGNFGGSWELGNPDNLSDPPLLQSSSLLEIANAQEGSYLITYRIEDDSYPAICDARIEISLFIESYKDAGQENGILQICKDASEDIDLFSLIDDYDEGGQWSLNGTDILNTVNASDLTVGLNEFSYSFEEGAFCPSSSVLATIEVLEKPSFTYTSKDVLCFGESNGEIEIIIASSNNTEVTCYLNDIIQEGGKIIDNLDPGEYEIYIKDAFCESNKETIVITEPDPLLVSLGDDREIKIDEEIVIEAITNLTDSDIDNISWTNLAEIIGLDVLELTTIISENSTIQIEITDSNGCIALDQIKINVLEEEEEIYIPNIINVGSSDNNKFILGNMSETVSIVKDFKVYDRWGNLVYELNDVSPTEFENAAWNGNFNNQEAEQGVYLYLLAFEYINGREEIISGDLTLIR